MPIRSPLHEVEEEANARFEEFFGRTVVSDFGDTRREYRAARGGAAVFDVSYLGRLRVAGRDRVRYLHSLLSNDISGLQEERGCYATLLTRQGRMESDLFAYAARDEFWIECPPAGAGRLLATLKKYIVADKVEIEDWTDRLAALSVQGPRSREIAGRVVPAPAGDSPELSHYVVTGPSGVWRVIRRDRTGCGGYDIWLPAEGAPAVWKRLVGAEDVRPAGHDALNVLRTEAGVPWYGVDMDEGNLPMEFGLTRAISFTKGCYRGQEIVARVTHRGHLDRRLGGVAVEGFDLPARGAEVRVDGARVGEVTSGVVSPRLERVLALAVLKLSALTPGTAVEVQTAPGFRPGVVVSLPL